MVQSQGPWMLLSGERALPGATRVEGQSALSCAPHEFRSEAPALRPGGGGWSCAFLLRGDSPPLRRARRGGGVLRRESDPARPGQQDSSRCRRRHGPHLPGGAVRPHDRRDQAGRGDRDVDRPYPSPLHRARHGAGLRRHQREADDGGRGKVPADPGRNSPHRARAAGHLQLPLRAALHQGARAAHGGHHRPGVLGALRMAARPAPRG